MEERKTGKSSTRAKNKYNQQKYDRINLVVPSGEKEEIAEAAKRQGYKSTNEFIRMAIQEKKEKG